MPDRPDYDKLTDPEINRLCVERVGWTDIFTSQINGEDCGRIHGISGRIPNYCNNRNALDSLWAHMTDEQWFAWEYAMRTPGVHLSFRQVLTATPRQHCEAFLKATEVVK